MQSMTDVGRELDVMETNICMAFRSGEALVCNTMEESALLHFDH